MNFRDYYKSLTQKQRAEYARRAGTTTGYIHCHLLADPPRRVPRLKTIERMASATDGAVTFEELVEYFRAAAKDRAASELVEGERQ